MHRMNCDQQAVMAATERALPVFIRSRCIQRYADSGTVPLMMPEDLKICFINNGIMIMAISKDDARDCVVTRITVDNGIAYTAVLLYSDTHDISGIKPTSRHDFSENGLPCLAANHEIASFSLPVSFYECLRAKIFRKGTYGPDIASGMSFLRWNLSGPIGSGRSVSQEEVNNRWCDLMGLAITSLLRVTDLVERTG